MRKIILTLCVLFPAALLFCQTTPDAQDGKKKTLTTRKEKVSYTIGYDMGESFKAFASEVDREVLVQGLRHALTGKAPLLSAEEIKAVLEVFSRQLEKKHREDKNILGEKNKREGEVFLQENAKKEGRVTTKSGLQYRIIKEGTGAQPGPYDIVTVHFVGTLINGTRFHSTYKAGKPAVFPVIKAFSGWAEALRKMKVGAKWQLFIPPDLAHGEKGLGIIGPHAVILMELELLAVAPPEKEGKEKPPGNVKDK